MNGTLTVLIVDDSNTVRRRLRALVDEVSGVRVVAEASGLAEARVAVGAVRPDVVVLDLRLGDGNGLELLRELGPSRPAVRVIVLTNDAWPQYRRECLAAGAAWFFDKTTEFHRVPEVLADEASARARHEDRAGSGEDRREGGGPGEVEPDGSTSGGGVRTSAAVGAGGGSCDGGFETGVRMVAAGAGGTDGAGCG